jgi:hypothetical protein
VAASVVAVFQQQQPPPQQQQQQQQSDEEVEAGHWAEVEDDNEDEGEDEEEDEDAATIPMPGQELVAISATVGSREAGFQDGAAAEARFSRVCAMLCLPGGRVLAADSENNRIRLLSADLQDVSTVAGDGEEGHRDGAAAQAQFNFPQGLLLLSDGCVLVADYQNNCIRMLSADLQQVSTVAGDVVAGGGMPGYDGGGHQDGASAQARFCCPSGFALLPCGRVLVADGYNCRIRMLSADLQQVTTVVGDGTHGNRDGAAAQAQVRNPYDLVLLSGGRVLVAEFEGDLRLLSHDLQEVSTAVGDGEWGYRDGSAAQARFDQPKCLALLPDGRVLVSDVGNDRIRVLGADMQDVSTLTIHGVDRATAYELLPDGRVLVADDNCIHVLEGLVAVSMGSKPAPKPPKNNKRALAGGASASSNSSGPALKRGRSGAGS